MENVDMDKVVRSINALADFVVRVSAPNTSATAAEVAALPAVAKIVSDYWIMARPR